MHFIAHDRFIISHRQILISETPEYSQTDLHVPVFPSLSLAKGPVSNVLQQSCTEWPPVPPHTTTHPFCPTPHPNAEASVLLSTQSCSTPWPRSVPHYRAVRKLLGAPVTLKDWWRKMGQRRGEEQVVKKRMSCLMGCQECNSIIMKSDSWELEGWTAEWPLRRGIGLHMPEHPHPQVNRSVFDLKRTQLTNWRCFSSFLVSLTEAGF